MVTIKKNLLTDYFTEMRHILERSQNRRSGVEFSYNIHFVRCCCPMGNTS